ncbi:Transthyretin-like family protein [Ostertagia ostertagi]
MGLLTALIALLVTLRVIGGDKGTVNAYGCAYCHGDPLRNVTVKMYDVDTVLDDFMGQTVTDRNGCFFVNGSAEDLRSEIDPVINFYHTCPMFIDYGRCILKSRLVLEADEVIDVDFVNLTNIEVTKLETIKDCIH